MATTQQIRFCRTVDGVRIAYALVGSGPPLVYVNGWPEHLQLEWEQPFANAFLRRLATSSTLIRYDMRGSGLSDRELVEPVKVEVLERDLLTVVGQVGGAPLPLLSLGMLAGPIALRFAAEHPERVERLVVVGGYLRGSELMDADRRPSFVDYVRHHGFPHFDFVDGPGVGLDDVRGVVSLAREGAPPAFQADLLDAMFAEDLSDVVDRVACPTLVMHVAGDRIVPVEQGRELAASLPDAEFRVIQGDTAAIWSLADAVVPAIQEFFGRRSGPPTSTGSIALTARERDVLACMCDGLANREIAAELCISEKTVKSHVGQIFTKLGVRDRTSAVVRAFDTGLVERP